MDGGADVNGADGADGADGRKVRGAITTVHRYELPLPPEKVWSLICAVDRYRSWWPWLREFEAHGMTVGDEWRCMVQPPVPYLVRFRVVIDHVEAPSLVRARVLGDVVGDATLTLETQRRGTTATPARPAAMVRPRTARPGQPGAWRPCTARSRRATPRWQSCRASPRRSPASGTTGCSILRPGNSSPRRWNPPCAIPLRRREVLGPPDPGLGRGCGAGGADRIVLRRHRHDHRGGHRLGRRDLRVGVGRAIDRARS